MNDDSSEASSEHESSLQISIDVLGRFISKVEKDQASNEKARRDEDNAASDLDGREVETEGSDFQNVYQVYAPRLVLNNQSRNVSHASPFVANAWLICSLLSQQHLMQYWFSNRRRKGLEYYLSNKYAFRTFLLSRALSDRISVIELSSP